jgi:hypothetical protein
MTDELKVTILPTAIWIENTIFGQRIVVAQHEGMDAFDYAVFNYRYGYTDNASTERAAIQCALSIGANEPVEIRQRAPASQARPAGGSEGVA